MKIKYLSLSLLLLFITGSLMITSCEDNNATELTDTISAEETSAFVEADDITDDLNNVIDNVILSESLTSRTNFLECMTVTIVITGTTKTVTLDFGDGCMLPNGATLSGKIILYHAVDMNVESLTVSHTFENFYYNDISVEGGGSTVKLRANANGNPESTTNFDITLTWPTGDYISKVGTKTREWIEGVGSGTWGDNVFLITGNWTTTFRDGTVFSANIVEALRREMACRFIVSGVIELQKNDRYGTLDFGDGTCDNIAIFTDESGEETEITL